MAEDTGQSTALGEEQTRPAPSRHGASFRLALTLSLPAIAVAAIILVAAEVSVGLVIAATLPVIVGLAFFAWWHIGEVQAADTYLHTLIDQVDADVAAPVALPPTLYGWGVDRLAGLGRQIARAYRRRIQNLADERGELAAVAETIADPMILVGQDRRVRLDNRASRQRFGHTLFGRDLADGLRDPNVLGTVDSVLAGGDAKTIVLDSVAPAERVYEARVAPFPRSQVAERKGALLTLHDITAIKRSEQTRADFVANASHELRNPLSILSGCVETLQTTARDDAEARERFLSMMNVQADRMTRLINDLLSLSRVEIDEFTRPNGTVMLKQVIATVVDYLRIKAEAKNMSLIVDSPELPEIVGDPGQIEQIMTNLIDNAINYGTAGTEVTIKVRLRASDDQVKGPVVDVSVQDRGDGIAREHLARLTERFYRIDKARSRTLGGTGLGLAIVKHIVARHQGRLMIQSNQDGDSGPRGSIFTAVLPIEPEARQDN